jgi:thiamine-phosphate pyrophosphorylase
VYALGGMNIDNVREMKALGFGGVVICGDLWNRFNIHNEIDYKELLNHFVRLKKTLD